MNSQMDLQGPSEKETRRGRDEPEKVVKQWERDPESESERDDEGSKQRLRVEDPDRRSSGGPSKKLLGDSHSNQGIRRESREIYRRISDDSTYPPSEDVSQKQEKKPAEAARQEVQRLEKTKEEGK